MPASNPVGILIAHNHWATNQIINALQSLTDSQVRQEFEMGPGSLLKTINHILGAMQGWGDLLAGREQRPRVAEMCQNTAEMKSALSELTSDIRHSADQHPVEETLSGERGGRAYSFTRGAILTHVMTHGMHHRAQCLNMLRQLGVEPLPQSSVMEWTFVGESV
jgi:uncharacterized damage-inducible protein DinB